jgi:hypothetical protein
LLPYLISPPLFFALFLSLHSHLFRLHHHYSPPFYFISSYSFVPYPSSSFLLSIPPFFFSFLSFILHLLHPSTSASSSSFSLFYLIIHSSSTFSSSFLSLLSPFFLLHFLQIIFLSYLFFIPFSSIPPSSYFITISHG